VGSATSIFAFQSSDKAKEVLQPPPLVADSKEDSSSPSEQLKVAGGDNTHNIPTTTTTTSEELRREANKLIVEDASPDDEDPLLSTTNGEGEKTTTTTTTTTAKGEEDSPGGTKTKPSSFFASVGTQGSPTRSKHIFFPDDPAVPLTSTTTTTTSPLRTSTTATAPEFIPLGSRTTKAGGSEDKRPGSKAEADRIMARIEALMEREGELDEGEEDDDIEPLDPDDLESYDWNKDFAYGGKEGKGKGGLVGYNDDDEDDDDDDDDTNDEDGDDYDTGGKGSSSDEDPGDSFFVSKGKDKPLFWQDKTGGDGALGDLVRAAENRGREPFGGGGGEKAGASIDAGDVPSFPSFSPAGTGGGPSSIFGATPFPSFGATTATTTTSEAGGAAPSTLAFPFGATTTPTPTADSAGSSPFSFNFQPSTDTPAFSLGDAHWPSGRRPASGRGRGSRRI